MELSEGEELMIDHEDDVLTDLENLKKRIRYSTERSWGNMCRTPESLDHSHCIHRILRQTPANSKTSL